MKEFKDISILIPVYNEEESILELYNEIINVLNDLYNYEIIFINDGSTDNSKSIILNIIKDNKHVRLIHFFKNRGKAEALNAGFEYVLGKKIITLDADLQDDPNEIPALVEKIDDGYDMVSGWKKSRKDPISKVLPSKIFNFVVKLFSGINIHDFNCGLKAYKSHVIKSIHLYGGLHRFIPVLVKSEGFSIGEIIVNHRKRKYGVTKYGSSRLFHGLYDFITILFLKKYFNRPLHLFGKFGILFSLVGIVVNLYLTFNWFNGEWIVPHKNPLFFLGILLIIVGIQFISIGLIGELIVHFSRKRKNYINSADFYNVEK